MYWILSLLIVWRSKIIINVKFNCNKELKLNMKREKERMGTWIGDGEKHNKDREDT